VAEADAPTPLRCAACRHEIAYDDAILTVAGRRFHAACVDAHHADAGGARGAVGVIARYVSRFARSLGR
jgi:hypothetical protein